MKTILTLTLTLIFSFSYSQDMVVKSLTLDSLIWKKINEYRVSKNVAPFNTFEYSDIRDYSYNVTTSNSKLEMIEHSGNNFHIYNIECIYSWVKTYPDGFLDIIKVKDWEYLADDIVNSWIASPPHEIGISSDQFTKATITTILTIDSNTDNYRLDASYHGKY